MKRILRFILVVTVFLNTPACYAQESSATGGFDSLSLADLMNIKITVASLKELTPQESPGIISIITATEIERSGAQDLMDLLQYIPGFDFGTDVQGAVGLAVRGNWSHEGKVMLLIDGQEMTDGLYSTLQFGNHYPVEHIERIEIIRGPGSAIYGGFAAYAVINIITKSPEKSGEFDFNTTTAAGQKGLIGSKVSTYAGYASNDFKVAIDASSSSFDRSQETYQDVFGHTTDMKGNSAMQNQYFNLAASKGKFSGRFIGDLYTLESADQYLAAASKAYPVSFNSYYGELKYELELSPDVKLTPRVNYRYQEPWKIDQVDASDDITLLAMSSQRATASLQSSADVKENLNLTAGWSFFKDWSINQLPGEVFNTSGKSRMEYTNSGLFLQMLLKERYFNLTAGLYYNNNSRYDAVIAPRLGVTHTYDRGHLKLLYSHSFRSPSTQNIDLSTNIKPEQTDVFEIENGISLSEKSYLTLNAYHIITSNPIIFYFDTITNFDAYANFSRTGSSGFELIYRYKSNDWNIVSGGSYYFAKDGSDFSNFSVPGEPDEHLGLSRLKWNLTTQYNIFGKTHLHAGATLLGARSGISALDPTTLTYSYTRYKPQVLINLGLTQNNVLIHGLSLNLEIQNILNQDIRFVQPYSSGHAPLPGMKRNLSLTLRFKSY